MTKEEFRKLTENILILDGATGSNLMASGMPRGICTETWVIDHKDIIQDLQRAYIQAGSQVIYAPTFGGNSINLEKHGLRDKIEEINRTLVGYSKELAGSGIYVAGDITTSGSFITADGDYTYTEAYNMYQEQIRILADAGIDLIAAETMINIEETLAAVDAAASVCDLPIMCTMTVEADGSIFSGGNAVEAAVSLEAAGADAVGINCSVGPDQLVSVVRNIKENVSIPVIAKPNAGMPVIDEKGNAVLLYGDNVQTSKQIVALALVGETHDDNGKVAIGNTPEWHHFSVDFEYKKAIDPIKLKNGGYSLTIVSSSSSDGANFLGAERSTLWIDSFKLICK